MVCYDVPGWPENGVTVRFTCPKCKKYELVETVRIPSPNLSGEKDTYAGTQNMEDTILECPCGHRVTVTAIVNDINNCA